jgi:hypothetical protein
MKSDPLLKFITLAVLAGLAVAFTTAARAEDAKDITRTGTYATSNGASGTVNSNVTRANGVVTRKGTFTNAAGGTGSFQNQAVWNKSTHSATVNGSVTRPNGATTSWQGTAVRTAPGVISEKGTITGPRGGQATYTGTATRTAPGSWDNKQVITNANGTVTDRNVQTTVVDGQGNRVTTVTLPDGSTMTRTATFTQAAAPTPTPNP